MHVHANAAISVDGKLATRERRQVALSGPEDFARVDLLRDEMDAILVGVGTVKADDPSLTGANDRDPPARVVLDSAGRTPLDARLLDNAAPTYVVVTDRASASRREALEHAGATILPVAGDRHVDVSAATTALESAGIDRLLIEGGGEVLASWFAAGLVDELTVFIAPSIVGGRSAPTLVDGEGFTERFPRLELTAVERIDTGLLCRYDVGGWEETPAAQSSD